MCGCVWVCVNSDTSFRIKREVHVRIVEFGDRHSMGSDLLLDAARVVLENVRTLVLVRSTSTSSSQSPTQLN